MLKVLAKRTEDLLDTIEDVIKRVAAHAGIRQLSDEELRSLKSLIAILEKYCAEEKSDKASILMSKLWEIGLLILNPHLPRRHD
jgi:hypothetical protein